MKKLFIIIFMLFLALPAMANEITVPEPSSSSGGSGAVDSVNGNTGVVVLTTGDLAEDTNKNYVTDAESVVVGHTSGTNTGDNSANSSTYSPGGTDVALADGGTGESLADPGADRILFWDDSEGELTWLIPGTGLAISATTLNVSITSLDIGLTDTHVLVGNGSNLAVGVDMTGDVTISNTGVMTIGTDKIDPAMISTDAVTPDAIDKDGAFTGLTGNWATTGTLSGGSLTPVTDNATEFAGNFTGGNLYGGTFVCDVAGTIQLPLMVAGMNFTVITLGAIAVVIDTNANDGYLMDGVTGTEGANLTNLSTAGDIAVIQYYTADDWLITTNGWTAE